MRNYDYLTLVKELYKKEFSGMIFSYIFDLFIALASLVTFFIIGFHLLSLVLENFNIKFFIYAIGCFTAHHLFFKFIASIRDSCRMNIYSSLYLPKRKLIEC